MPHRPLAGDFAGNHNHMPAAVSHNRFSFAWTRLAAIECQSINPADATHGRNCRSVRLNMPLGAGKSTTNASHSMPSQGVHVSSRLSLKPQTRHYNPAPDAYCIEGDAGRRSKRHQDSTSAAQQLDAIGYASAHTLNTFSKVKRCTNAISQVLRSRLEFEYA